MMKWKNGNLEETQVGKGEDSDIYIKKQEGQTGKQGARTVSDRWQRQTIW